MPRVNLFLLGPPRLEQDGQPLEIDARKTLALLAYLAVSGEYHRRETLDALLWPDLEPRRGRAVLRRNLSTLNKTLNGQWLVVDKDMVGLDHSADAWLDVAEFRQLARNGQDHDHANTELCPDCLTDLAAAATLYRADFMTGFTVRDSPNFDDWQLFESERLKRELAGVLEKLARGYGERNELEPAITYAQRWLNLDPLHEPAHRRLMQLYAANGDRSAALRQYQTCVQVLEEELGLPPEDETTTLYERIRRESQRHRKLIAANFALIDGDTPQGMAKNLTPITPIPAPVGPPPACPYRGLFAFREADAPFFFGREAFTRQMIEAVQQQALVAVVGPSGSGKSSVVFAGLLAHLLQKNNWIIVKFRPGSNPFQALAAALLTYLEPGLSQIDQLAETRKLAGRFATTEIPLADVVERILEKDPAARRLMLVADQFEELYTLCPDPESRHDFLDLLFECIDRQQYLPSPTFTFVFTLRADFLEQALGHRPFADALQNNDLKLGPMTRAELGRAIENPAEKQGVTFESGLVNRILDDVGDEPGNLPLLEFALTTLWEQQQLRQLTHAGYEAIGRVEGALTRHADEIYASLTSSEQTAARRIFTQLVRPGESTEDTRRLARRAELSQDDWQLAQRLADARLVVTGRDAGGNETVEVVHEALIRSWDQLRAWMETDRTFRAWQERLRATLRQWEAAEQDEGALLRGVPLATAEEWLAERPNDLSEIEHNFIEAGIDLREREIAEQEMRRQRELEAAKALAAEAEARRQAEEQHAQEAEARAQEQTQAAANLRRRALLLAGVGIVAVLLAIAAGVFGMQSSRNAMQAEAERAKAERQAKVALSRQLALEVAEQLEQGNVDTALLLAVEAGRAVETVEAFTALRQAINHPRSLLLTLFGHTDDINQVIWSADERRILTASFDSSARVWDAETGAELLTLNHEDNVTQAMWNKDESRILTASVDGTARIWDAETGEELLVLSNADAGVVRAYWDAAERRILTSGNQGAIQMWDAETGTELLSLSGHAGPAVALWDAGDKRILSLGVFDHIIKVWSAETGEELLTMSGHTDAMWWLDRTEDQSRLLTSSADGTARVWDLETGAELISLTGHTAEVWHAEWNADESQIVTASEDGTAKIWDAKTGAELVTLSGHTAAVKRAVWHPVDNLILTTSEDGTARVWNAGTGAQVGPPFGHTAAVLWATWNAAGSRFLTGTGAGTVRVWRWGQPEIKPELPTLNPAIYGLLRGRWNADESRILLSGYGPNAHVWDAASGERLFSLDHANTLWQSVWNKAESRILTASNDGTAKISDAETGETLLTLSAADGFGFWWAGWNVDESRILTTSADGTAKIWDAETGEALLTFAGHTDEVVYGSWNTAEDRVLTASYDGTARVWNATTGQELLTLIGHTGPLWRANWNADESRILTVSDDGSARVWDAETGAELLNLAGHTDVVRQAVWSQDESRILTASSDGSAKVWDAENGGTLLTLNGHTDWVRQAIWNEDESLILTASKDGTARVWDAATGAELVVLSDHTDTVNEARWNADESRILTVSSDGTARQYYTRLEDVSAVACGRLSRNLTRAEWQQFMDDQPYRATCPNLSVPEE